MLIREATSADLPGILDILKEMDGEDGLELSAARSVWEQIEQYPYYKIFIVEEDQVIIGTCSLIIIGNLGHYAANVALAENMIIRSGHRGKSIGQKLMQYIMEQAKEKKCYKLMLSSNKKRVEAHRFYEQLGFQQHGISFMIEV